MSILRRRTHARRGLPSPAMVVAIAALVMSLTGSAVAAKKYLITSKKQISPKVLKQLKGAKGKTGATGAAGAGGATGPQGPKGDTGARGPSNGYSAAVLPPSFISSPAGTGFFDVASLSLPAGNYVISAKANINNNDASPVLYTCRLVAGSDVDETYNGTAGAADLVLDKQHVAMSLAHAFAAPGSATVRCNNPGAGAGDVVVDDVRITAIQVETLG